MTWFAAIQRLGRSAWGSKARIVGRGLMWVAALGSVAWVGSRAAVGVGTSAFAEPKRSAAGTSATAPHPSASGPTGLASTSHTNPPCGSPERVPGAVLPDGRIALNLAGPGDLMQLPGIGEKRARAIVALRTKLGRFRTIRDLLRVKGIGPNMLRRLEPRATLEAMGATVDESKPRGR